MFYSFKNSPILLNNVYMFANNVNISENSNNNAAYLIGNRHSFEYSPSDGIIGNMSLSYYLTGEDFLKKFINNERQAISGNIGGLYFSSGYLSSYSVNMIPNNPIIVEAQISFFDNLKGIFCANYNVVEEKNILNFSNVEITNLNTCSLGVIDNIIQINYKFNSQIQPIYKIGDYKTNEVAFGEKNISLELVTDNLAPDLSIYGKKAGIKVNLTHPLLTGINENFTCSGILYGRQISSQNEEILQSVLSIKQNYIYAPPTIAGFNPQNQDVLSYIYITGENLINTTKVLFNSLQNNVEESQSFKVISDNLVYVQVPNGSFSGPIKIENFYGIAESSGILIVQYPQTSMN